MSAQAKNSRPFCRVTPASDSLISSGMHNVMAERRDYIDVFTGL
jgi:hypothetical protein